MENTYHVCFFKRLVDSNGHPVDAYQGEVDICADDQDRAVALARRQFAAIKDVKDWSLRADYERVELLASRKPVPKRERRSRRAQHGAVYSSKSEVPIAGLRQRHVTAIKANDADSVASIDAADARHGRGGCNPRFGLLPSLPDASPSDGAD
jgi:hypothetical protein